MTDILVLGAGSVSKPLVHHLSRDAGLSVTVASRTLEKAEKVTLALDNAKAVRFDISKDPLQDLIPGHDVVVSLLPYIHHTKVANAAIRSRIHMVTTSYVSDEMRSLDAEAKKSGVLLMNEMGLDPGIDHMEAMRVIDGIKEEGGRIKEFISYCGGLPAPEANTNPWGYKFSWSPKGVVLASMNSARFRRNGKEVEIPGKELFGSYENIRIEGLGEFEGYPNRDSVPYADIYGIQEASTILRGTLRNKGWCDTWKGLHDIGLLEEKITSSNTYREMMEQIVPGSGDLESRLKRKMDTRDDRTALSNWEWLGLLSDREILDRGSIIDAFSALLEDKLQYEKGERDMIILKHTFRYIDGNGEEKSSVSTMVDHGIPYGDSAMSRTVGIPAAIGVQLITEGRLDDLKGVHIPVLSEVYEPVLERLCSKNIEFHCH